MPKFNERPKNLPAEAELHHYMYIGIHNDKTTKLYQFVKLAPEVALSGAIPDDLQGFLNANLVINLEKPLVKSTVPGAIVSVWVYNNHYYLTTAAFEKYAKSQDLLVKLQTRNLIVEQEIQEMKEGRKLIEFDAVKEQLEPFRQLYLETNTEKREILLALIIRRVTQPKTLR